MRAISRTVATRVRRRNRPIEPRWPASASFFIQAATTCRAA
jgi:hypothetical protein